MIVNKGVKPTEIAVLAHRWNDLKFVQHFLQEFDIPCQFYDNSDNLQPTNSLIGQKVLQHLRQDPSLKIEQFFATLKLASLDIESTQLESPEAIKKLTVLVLSVAVRTLQIVEGRESSQLSASMAFSDTQLQCLSDIEPTLQGNTEKQKNPHPRLSLPWATWIICSSRWLVWLSLSTSSWYSTIVNGLQRFEAISLGWILPHYRLVCTR